MNGYSWSPWLGCRKVSPGCDLCYITRTTPYRVRHIEHGAQREELSEAYWKHPEKWDAAAARAGVSSKVFPSLCDPFDAEVPLEWFVKFIRVIHRTPNLDWLLLTKRPQCVLKRLADAREWFNEKGSMRVAIWLWDWINGRAPGNVHLGVSVENQEWADKRRDVFYGLPAVVKFVSYEPALGPVDWSGWKFVNQIISGGESGVGTQAVRPSHAAWHKATRDWCAANGVGYFFKQWGDWLPFEKGDRSNFAAVPANDDARVHGWEDGSLSLRVGKKEAGRLLDGAEFNGQPILKPQPTTP